MKTCCMTVSQTLNKTVHMDCFDVFIILLVIVNNDIVSIFLQKFNGPKFADPSMSAYSPVYFSSPWLIQCSDAATAADKVTQCKGNYSATLDNMKLVHWPSIGVLLHLVQQGGDWVKLQPAQAPLRCTKCNSSPINVQCTNHFIPV